MDSTKAVRLGSWAFICHMFSTLITSFILIESALESAVSFGLLYDVIILLIYTSNYLLWKSLMKESNLMMAKRPPIFERPLKKPSGYLV